MENEVAVELIDLSNKLKPLLLNLPFFLPNPPPFFSYGATFCWLGRSIPLQSAQFPSHHLNRMPQFMRWYCSCQGNVLISGPSYPCTVCLRPFNKSKFSFKCNSWLSWVHQRWSTRSGLPSYTHHYDLNNNIIHNNFRIIWS